MATKLIHLMTFSTPEGIEFRVFDTHMERDEMFDILEAEGRAFCAEHGVEDPSTLGPVPYTRRDWMVPFDDGPEEIIAGITAAFQRVMQRIAILQMLGSVLPGTAH